MMSAHVNLHGWLRLALPWVLLPGCGPFDGAAQSGPATRGQSKSIAASPGLEARLPPDIGHPGDVAGAAAGGRLPQDFLDPETLERWARTGDGRPAEFADSVVAKWALRHPGIAGIGRSDTPVDPEANTMPTTPFVGALRRGADRPALRRAIPRVLHVLDFEPGGAEKGWEAFAARYQYQLRRWSDPSAPELTRELSPASARALASCVAMGHAGCATAVARLGVLRAQGGIAISASLRPPRWQGQPVDLTALLPMRDSVWVAAEGSRFVGGTSLTLAPDVLVAAAPGHPLVEAMESQAARLIPEAARARDDAALALFARLMASRVAGGPLQVIPLGTLRSYAMAPSPR